MVRVLATGTFDILHPGHIRYLEEARALGDELWVIVSRDRMIRHKPRPIIPEEQRLMMVRALRVVDHAILGSEGDIYEPLLEIKPDIVALGYDQHFDERILQKELEARGLGARVVRVSGFEQCPLCSTGAIVQKIIRDREKKR